MEIKLNNGKAVVYTPPCKHKHLKCVGIIETHDMDGWEVERYVYICLDCGLKIEKG